MEGAAVVLYRCCVLLTVGVRFTEPEEIEAIETLADRLALSRSCTVEREMVRDLYRHWVWTCQDEETATRVSTTVTEHVFPYAVYVRHENRRMIARLP